MRESQATGDRGADKGLKEPNMCSTLWAWKSEAGLEEAPVGALCPPARAWVSVVEQRERRRHVRRFSKVRLRAVPFPEDLLDGIHGSGTIDLLTVGMN